MAYAAFSTPFAVLRRTASFGAGAGTQSSALTAPHVLRWRSTNLQPEEFDVHHHPIATTTHTVEMGQIAELSHRLQNAESPSVTAGQLGLEGATARAGAEELAVPSTAILRGISWTGPPEFPDLGGCFAVPGHPHPAVVTLHTQALRRLSRLLGLRHVWGVGPTGSLRKPSDV